MDKIDLIRQMGDVYRPPAGGPVLVDVPDLSFLTIDGVGDPNTTPA